MSFTSIHYRGVDPFSGIAPTPFVGRTENMVQQGERLLTEETFILRGAITGHCTSEPEQFNEMLAMQVRLLNSFGSDFQPFDIFDVDGTTVIHRDNVKVISVNFPTNNYGSYHIYLPFEISLQAYPNYSGNRYQGYNVLSPVHTVQYQENDDATVQIEVTTSAKGINTSISGNNALKNAISWVNDFKDWTPPNVDSVYGNLNLPCLRTAQESINRYNGTYEIKETYMVDQLGQGPGILRYTTAYSYDLNEGISTIEINGTIEGCHGQGADTDMNSLRQRWSLFDLQAFSYAVVTYNAITNRLDLNPLVVSKNVSEDDSKVRISFRYAFNNDLRPPIFFEYKTSVEYDFDNDSFTVSVQGEIIDRNPLTSYTDSNGVVTTNKWQEIEDYASKVDLFALAQKAFNDYVVANPNPNISVGAYPLGPILISSSRTEDRENSKLGIGATYRTQAPYLPIGWQKFDFSLSCNPSLEQFKEFPCLDGNGQYQVYDLGFKTRAQYSLQANGIAPDRGDPTGQKALKDMRDEMNILIAKNVKGSRLNLDNQQISFSSPSFSRVVSASAAISLEGDSAFAV